jgi:hypothetical protein
MSDQLNVDELKRSFEETVQQAVNAEITKQLSAAVHAEITKQLSAAVHAEITKQLSAAVHAEITKQLSAFARDVVQMYSDAHKSTDLSQEAQQKQPSASKIHNDANNTSPMGKQQTKR